MWISKTVMTVREKKMLKPIFLVTGLALLIISSVLSWNNRVTMSTKQELATQAVVETSVSTLANGPLFNPGVGSSKLAIMNVDPSGTAAYSVKFLNSANNSTVSIAGSLPFRATRYINTELEAGLGTNWLGSVVLNSTKKMSLSTSNFYKGGAFTGGDNYNGEAYEAAEPSNVVFLPYATRVDNAADKRYSRISVQSTQTGVTNVTLEYKDQNGANLVGNKCGNPVSLQIQSERSVSFYPDFDCQGNTSNGSIKLKADKPIVAAFDGAWSIGSKDGWKTAYSGIPEGKSTTKLFYPNAFRRVNSAWVQWTNVFVQNTSSSKIKINVRFYKTGATTPLLVLSDNLLPYSAKEYNTRYGNGTIPANTFAALGSEFSGTVVVEVDGTPSKALVGLIHNFWGNPASASTYNAFSDADGVQKLYVPFAARRKTGNDWAQWDKISIMNVGTTNATIDVRYYNEDGTLAYSLTGNPKVGKLVIPASSVESINSQFGCDSIPKKCQGSDMEPLGTNFTGSIEISGQQGAKLIGVMNEIYPNRTNTISIGKF